MHVLKESNRRLQRAVCDAQASARAAEQGVRCDQLAVIGLPVHDLPSVRDIFIAVAERIGVEISPDAILDARLVRPAGTQGPDGDGGRTRREAAGDSSNGNAGSKNKMFVTLQFAELRTIFLGKAREIRNLHGGDIGLPHLPDFRMEIFEVLVGAKHDLFVKIRQEAQRIGIYKVWHRNGIIFARKSSGSSAVRVYDVGDLAKLRD